MSELDSGQPDRASADRPEVAPVAQEGAAVETPANEGFERAPEPATDLRDLFHRLANVIPDDQEIESIAPEMPAGEALKTMVALGFSQLPIMRNNVVLDSFSFRSFAIRPPKTQRPPLNGEPTLERPQRRMNRRSPWAASATQGERIERQLLRGSERDLELEGDTRRRVERVVPGLSWDA